MPGKLKPGIGVTVPGLLCGISPGLMVAGTGGGGTVSPGFTIQRTGAQYPTYNTVYAAAIDGDTILINPTLYDESWQTDKSLNFKSAVAGQRWQLAGTLLNRYNGTTFQALTIEDGFWQFRKTHPNIYGGPTNAPVSISWAGFTTGTLTIRNCVFDDCAMPVLTSRYVTDVLFESCEFKNCGSTDSPSTHCLYVHASNQLTVRGCWFHCTYGVPQAANPLPAGSPWNSDATWVGIGHAIKSRSFITTVQACFIDNRTGSMSELIDIGDAGSLTVEGCVILEGSYSGADPTEYDPVTYPGRGYPSDTKILGYINAAPGDPPPEWPAGPVVLRQNTIVNYGQSSEQLLKIAFGAGGTAPASFDVRENVIVGTMADLPNANYPTSLNSFYTSAAGLFVDPANNNFALVAPVQGAANYGAYAFVAPSTFTGRTDAFRGAVPVSGVPAYILAHPVGQWFVVPVNGLPASGTLDDLTTNFAGGSMGPWGNDGSLGSITNYSGATKRNLGSWYLLKGGGHDSTKWNGLLGVKLNAASPSWVMISPATPTSSIQTDPLGGDPAPPGHYALTGRYLDGKQCTGHSFAKPLFMQTLDKFVMPGSGVSYIGSGGSNAVDYFDFAAWLNPAGNNGAPYVNPLTGWTQGATYDNGYYGAPNWCVDTTLFISNAIACFAGPVAGPFNTVGNLFTNQERYGPQIVDTARNCFIWMDQLEVGSSLVRRFNNGAFPTFNYTGTTIPADVYMGGCYDSDRDKYLIMGLGGQVYQIDPVTQVCSAFPQSGGVAHIIPTDSSGRTVGTRFQYLPELKCVVYQEGHNFNGSTNGDGSRPGRLLMMRMQ